MGARAVEPAHFRTLSTALLSRRRLEIRHHRRKDGDVLERQVSPQRLVHYRDNWYLDAFCHKRQALRTFAVDAIEHARVLDDEAKAVSGKPRPPLCDSCGILWRGY
jgi:predicted DNA-binding transcriptional regulator YafY